MKAFIIGFLEDNVGNVGLPWIVDKLGGCTNRWAYPEITCYGGFTTNQPFLESINYALVQFVGPFASYSILVFLGLLLTIFVTQRFFSKFFNSRISKYLGLIFVLSPYFYYQSRSHLELVHVWTVVLILDTYLFYEKKYKSIVLGLMLSVCFGISSYLGFVAFLLITTLTAVDTVSKLNVKKILVFKKTGFSNSKSVSYNPFRLYLLTMTVSLASSLLYMYPYFEANYIKSHDSNKLSKLQVARPIEDFVTFSSRPWYYIIPPVDNPFLGDFAKKTLSQLQNNMGYLAQNHFKSEHSASYLGLTNGLLASIGLITILRRRGNQIQTTHKQLYKSLGLGLIILFLLSMPPIITIYGKTLLTPSYILFKAFPMFRVLSRISVVILLLFLIFVGVGLNRLDKLIYTKYGKVSSWLLFAILFATTTMENFIPIKITLLGKPPQVYSLLNEIADSEPVIITYPKSKITNTQLWASKHHGIIIGGSYYKSDYEDTDEMYSDIQKILSLKPLNADTKVYLLYYYNSDQAKLEKSFEDSPNFIKIRKYEYTQNDEIALGKDSLIRLLNSGNSVGDSLIVYEIRRQVK